MELDNWLDAFDAFSDEEVNEKIEAANAEVTELQSRADALMTRAASLRVMLDARRKSRAMSQIKETSQETLPTFGDVISTRSSNGTSQAILDLMRTDEDSNWPISRILQGLEFNERLPTSKDPRRAVDATLHRLASVTGELNRVGRGVYRLSPSTLNEKIEKE